ncbi:MAG: MFS transporter [Gammaproteobacteria bacterium]
MTQVPYWRLSGFYLFYFATVGTFLPFWGIYLESLAFSPAQIGELMALLVVGKIVAPYLWGWIADHNGNRMGVIRFAGLVSILVFTGALFTTSYVGLALVMLVFGFFWSASLPQFEVVTLNHLGDEAHAYSRIRLWGSIGFILTVIFLGAALERFGVQPLPWIVFVMTIGIWITSLVAPDDIPHEHTPENKPIKKVILKPTVVAMMIAFFLMQIGHGAYYSFYSLYLEKFDYSRTLIGQLWALGVIAEVGLFLIMLKLLNRFSLKSLLFTSLICAAIRWFLIGLFPEDRLIIFLAQFLHAATFGIHHAVAIQLIHRYFKGRHQGRGQALYSALSYGAGGAIGSLLSGYIWEGLGPSEVFIFAGIVSVLASLIVWKWVRTEN